MLTGMQNIEARPAQIEGRLAAIQQQSKGTDEIVCELRSWLYQFQIIAGGALAGVVGSAVISFLRGQI